MVSEISTVVQVLDDVIAAQNLSGRHFPLLKSDGNDSEVL